MAVIQCPHCGKYISSTLKTCPECDKPLVLNEQENADNAYPGHPSLSRKSSPWWRKRKFLASILCLFLSIFAVSFYVYHTHKRYLELEQRAYARLAGCTNLDFFEDYIVRFPDGQHIEKVKRQYNQIKTERTNFLKMTSQGSREEYLNFIKRYPSSPYSKVCELRIDSIDWQTASSTNTISAYDRYLKLHPKGGFVSVAQVTRNKLGKLETSDEEHDKLFGALDAFLYSLATSDSVYLDKLIQDPITFCGQKNARGGKIVGIYQHIFNQVDILGVHFSVGMDMNIRKQPSVSHTGQYDYIVTAPVQATINRTETDSLNVQFWNISAQLTYDRKFTSVDLWRIK